MGHTLRAKIHHARALSVDPADIDRRRREFEEQSSEVYRRFLDVLDNGCNGDRKAAMLRIRADLGLSAADARIYVTCL